MNILVPNNSSDIFGFIHRIKNLNVSCKASSEENSNYDCLKAINPNEKIHFHSADILNQWINVTFNRNKILLTHYSIQAPNSNLSYHWCGPQSWIFRGLNEKGEWIDLDNVTNSGISEALSVVTRSINESNLYRSFSVQMYGLNYFDNPSLRIYKIDFFGSIDPPPGCFKTIACKQSKIGFNSLSIY